MAELKRKVSEIDTIAPPSKDPKLQPTINWRKLDLNKINPGVYAASKGSFGGWTVKWTYGEDKLPIDITGPWCTVAHDPSVWDSEKQMKYGKEKKPLDVNRKADKWNATLSVSKEFAEVIEAIKLRFAADIFANKHLFWDPKDPKTDKITIDIIASKFYEIVEWDAKIGSHIMKVDGRCAVGSTDVPMILEDTEGKSIDGKLGRYSEVAPMFTLGSAYINATMQNIKAYVDPGKFIVRKIVAPQVRDPSAKKADLDD